jgi:hypothetical protein
VSKELECWEPVTCSAQKALTTPVVITAAPGIYLPVQSGAQLFHGNRCNLLGTASASGTSYWCSLLGQLLEEMRATCGHSIPKDHIPKEIACLYVLDYKVLFLSKHPMISRICWVCCMGNNPICSHQPQLVAGHGAAWIKRWCQREQDLLETTQGD